ncbi:MAG TPA: hypothetical protein DCL77_05715, partial [Prolixibacteraceae bacterium]|nr:hypothetical protein [Prolixibacteraceae bacterium]
MKIFKNPFNKLNGNSYMHSDQNRHYQLPSALADGLLIVLLGLILPACMTQSELLVKKANKASAAFAGLASKGTAYKFKADTVLVDQASKKVLLVMKDMFSYIPFRTENTLQFTDEFKGLLGRRFRSYSVSIETMGKEIHELIPNCYRDQTLAPDRTRLSNQAPPRLPIVRNMSGGIQFPAGLYNRNIALWHSHGWYYENTLDRWEWQRARLFMTVEDLWTMSFVVPYITPMLENAGARVFLPRERDSQRNEIIIDEDGSSKGSVYQEKGHDFLSGSEKGFGLKVPFLMEGENPFQMGETRQMFARKNEDSKISYIPEIPEMGEYALYISYPVNGENVTDAHYTVFHSGGKTSFLVNQTMGGGTWIYLGTFRFEKGIDPAHARIELTNQSNETGKWVSADAVKLGGGMGNIVRGKIEQMDHLLEVRNEKGFEMDSSLWLPYSSQRPRYQEGARYYLQYAGIPDSLVYSINKKKSDYKDDYQSRGEWVNYLMGTPNGPTGHPEVKGLNVPMDMALAFHSDAGITPDSSIVGSLMIYNTTFAPETFPNGQSKWASRDLADIVQTQVVDDIKKLYDPQWTRRGMWNSQYSEAVRPKVPTVLSEFLSHQNFADMVIAQDPRFKFDVSRAYYKGILKFLAFQNGQMYVVQPLPVNHIQMSLEGKAVRLTWMPVTDELEPSAEAKSYKVYTRIEQGGFDNGQLVNEPALLLSDLTPGIIYSFKVTALNEGGESFPSEILACSLPSDGKKPVLIVNAFDRICGPEAFDNGKQAGFLTCEDEGVAYKSDLSFVGEQYDFNRKSPFKDDDASGFGSSHSDQETHIVQGNSFDYPLIHGLSFRNNGFGFISMSDEAFEQKHLDKNAFSAIDLIFGEEKTTKSSIGIRKKDFTLFTPQMREAIAEYASGMDHAHIFLSGAYIGSDLDLCGDTLARKFAGDVLHYKPMTGHASKSGKVFPVNAMRDQFTYEFSFVQETNKTIYKVESPDAIEPKG